MEPVVYTPVSAVANLRRATVIAAVVGVLAVVVTSLEGHPVMGIFAVFGLGLGAVNNRLLQKSVVTHGMGGSSKKRFRGNVAGRLGMVTVVALGSALLVRPDGVGVVVGLAVFHVIMLAGAAIPLFRSLRPTP